MPTRPLKKPQRHDTARNSATFIALFGLLTAAAALLGLAAMVVPSLLGILVVLFGFLFFGAFHYVAWGWWMSGVLAEPQGTAEDGRDVSGE